MNLLDEDSDSEVVWKTNNEYAKNYNNWRKKEELNKLKTKYGEEVFDEDESSSSSDDDEEGIELTENVEREFFRTLSCLKNKDPRIYDKNTKFFQDNEEKPKIKKKKEKPMYIKDYERKILLENNGKFSDSEDETNEDRRPRSPTYVEQQRQLKESFKQVLKDDDDDDDNDESEWGGLFKTRQKTEEEKKREEDDYKEWLKGQKEEIDDKEIIEDLKPLKDYWNNPKLDEGEKFLRDYILNKQFLDNDKEDYIPTYDEIIHDSDKDLSEDEKQIEKQEEFEHKYNFRFEEPDQEFIKRYPRTLENSVRKTDDRRKLKRQEVKERKQKEKEQKMQELKKLQELKKKEIEEKIEKLKEITGNKNVGFRDEDLEGDFDPEEHDRKMQTLFNDEFYQGEEDEEKPKFPELDEYLELENWDKYEGEKDDGYEEQEEESSAPHCEDEDFIMDADYDPNADYQKELIENSKGRKKKKKRKSLFAKAISQPKPVFDPNDKTFSEYLDEYYKFDCEDIVGDIPCRFKYRTVTPNNFGLTIEEILMAKDRELNKWCSLKKAVQIRPDHVERYDQIAYEKKAKNISLKKKILPSLFEPEKEENEEPNNDNKTENKNKMENTIKKGKKGNKDSSNQIVEDKNKIKSNLEDMEQNEKQERNVNSEVKSDKVEKPKKKKKKKKALVNSEIKEQNGINNNGICSTVKQERKRKINNKKTNVPNKKFKKAKNEDIVPISDARLSAYGINPKKFKNKLKYGKNKINKA